MADTSMSDEEFERLRIVLEVQAEQAARESAKARREFERLERSLDPAAKATQRYNRDVRTAEKALRDGTVTAAAHAKMMEQLTRKYDEASAAAMRNGKAVKMDAALHGNLLSTIRNNRAGFQQFGYQVGDAAVQIQGGTSALTALTQQGSQFLGVFGAFGAVAGAALAIGAPLAASFMATKDGIAGTGDATEDLTSATAAYVDAAEAASTPIEALRETYGLLAEEMREVLDLNVQLARGTAAARLGTAADELAERFGGFGRTQTNRDKANVVRRRLTGTEAELFGTELAKTIERIEDELEVGTDQARELADALERVGKAEGPAQTGAALGSLVEALEAAIGSTETIEKRVPGMLTQIGGLIEKAAQQSVTAEERARDAVLRSYDQRRRGLEALYRQQEVARDAHKEAQAAVTAARSAREDGLASREEVAAAEATARAWNAALVAIEGDVEKLLAADDRLGVMVGETEALQEALAAAELDGDGEVRAAAKALRDSLAEAVQNAADLDDASLSGLEQRFRGLVTMVEQFARGLDRTVDTLGTSAATAYGQYGSTRASSDRSVRAASARAAASSGILDLIGYAEGTDYNPTTGRGRGYNETLGYGAFTGGDVNLVNMTLKEVVALQRQMLAHPDNDYNSSAVGRYQIVGTTLRGLMKELGLSGDELFDADMQDRMGQQLVRRRRGQGADGYRDEWEGLRGVPSDLIDQALSAQSVPLQDADLAREALAAERELATERERGVEARRSLLDAAMQATLSAERELELMGKSAAEQARLRTEWQLTDDAKRRGIELTERAAGTEQTYAQRIKETAAAVGEYVAQKEREAERLETVAERAELMKRVNEDLRNGMLDAITEGRNFGDVLLNLTKMLGRAALEAALFNSGALAGGGGGGNWLAAAFKGIGAAFGFGSKNALGNVFAGGRVQPFAAGGIVDGPTAFPMAGGRTGLMGEAGPEGIMPLARMRNGKLGVNAATAAGRSAPTAVDVRVGVTVDDDGGLKGYVKKVSKDTSGRMLSGFSRRELPERVQRINRNPRERG